MNLKILITFLFVGSLAGCASVDTVHRNDNLYKHYVRMDRDGSPKDISTGRKIGTETFKKSQLQEIITNIENHLNNTNIEDKNQEKSQEEIANNTIVIYVHGAPLRGDVQVSESRNKFKIIQNTNRHWYPILLNWDGSLADVYLDNLFRIRQGREVSTLYGTATAPASLIGDLLVSIGRWPSTWFSQLKHIWVTEYPQSDTSGDKQAAKTQQLLTRQLSQSRDGQNEGVSQSADCQQYLKISKSYPLDPKFSPSTLVQLPIDAVRSAPSFVFSPFIASFGSSMWKNYNRRAQAAIRQGSEFGNDSTKLRVDDDTPSGTLATLVNEIAKSEVVKKHKANFILIGHSTGTIILSELVNTFLGVHADNTKKGQTGGNAGSDEDRSEETMEYGVKIKKIVFLGAAATIRDFTKTIVPYLRENTDTEFYGISLNGYDEAKSSYLGVITPSLLEWLDNSIAQPPSHMDRVMGKWENMMLAVHTIPCEIRGRVHLKHLPGEDGFPRHHRDLDELHKEFNPFKESDWEVEQQR